MYCAYCGKPNLDDANYCEYCGAAIYDGGTPPPVREPKPPANKKRSKLRLLLAIGIPVVAVLAVALALVLSLDLFGRQTLSDAEIDGIISANEVLEDMRTAPDYLEMDAVGRSGRAVQVLEQLADDGLVDRGSILYDQEQALVTFVYSSGVLGLERLEDFDPYLSGSPDSFAELPDMAESYGAEPGSFYSATSLSKSSKSTVPDSDVNALILYAWGNSTAVTSSDPLLSFYERLEESWDEQGIRTTLDSSVTLQDMATVSESISGRMAYIRSGRIRRTGSATRA